MDYTEEYLKNKIIMHIISCLLFIFIVEKAIYERHLTTEG